MVAIMTKYLSPTNSRGSRISVKADGHRIMVPYNHSLNTDGNHMEAAIKLCKKMGWPTQLVGGDIKDGMVFVQVGS